MMKVETALEFTEEFPAGRANTYIWMDGLAWPVPEGKDAIVLKVELFGDELQDEALIFPDSEAVRNLDGVIQERVWYGARARIVSAEMRRMFPRHDGVEQ